VRVPLVLHHGSAGSGVVLEGKTNLSHDGLNPAHVRCYWVNNPAVRANCGTRIARADIEGSTSGVALDALPPQASYPCGNFSVTSRMACP